MDSVPRDLRDALAEDLDPKADRASAADTIISCTDNDLLEVQVSPSPEKQAAILAGAAKRRLTAASRVREQTGRHTNSRVRAFASRTERRSQISWRREVSQRISTRVSTICEAGF